MTDHPPLFIYGSDWFSSTICQLILPSSVYQLFICRCSFFNDLFSRNTFFNNHLFRRSSFFSRSHLFRRHSHYVSFCRLSRRFLLATHQTKTDQSCKTYTYNKSFHLFHLPFLELNNFLSLRFFFYNYICHHIIISPKGQHLRKGHAKQFSIDLTP